MINHARTLLLNINHRRAAANDIGFEYIPESFTPVRLSNHLQLVRAALLGTAPDNYFLNARARELMGYLHETELVQYVEALDPRITYWPPARNELFEQSKARVDVVQVAGPPIQLNMGGSFSANASTGKSTQDYSISLSNLDAGGIELKTELITTAQKTETDKTVVQSFSSLARAPAIALAETSLNYSVNYAAAITSTQTTAVLLTETQNIIVTEQYAPETGLPYGLELEPTSYIASMRQKPIAEMQTTTKPRLAISQIPVGTDVCRWRLRAQVNPKPAISNIALLEILGEPTFLTLFGVAPTEPYTTFKNLWFDHPLPVYRMCGLVLALIYRTHEAQNAAK
jgi:hypothetical protein